MMKLRDQSRESTEMSEQLNVIVKVKKIRKRVKKSKEPDIRWEERFDESSPAPEERTFDERNKRRNHHGRLEWGVLKAELVSSNNYRLD